MYAIFMRRPPNLRRMLLRSRFGLLPLKVDHGLDDLIGVVRLLEADRFLDAGGVGHAADEVIERPAISLIVGDVLDAAPRAGQLDDTLRELIDGDLFGAAEIEDATGNAFVGSERDECANDVLHMAEAASLLAVAVDGNRPIRQRGLDE